MSLNARNEKLNKEKQGDVVDRMGLSIRNKVIKKRNFIDVFQFIIRNNLLAKIVIFITLCSNHLRI